VFRSRNHLPRSPSRLPLRLPGFARTAPSKQQAASSKENSLNNRIRSGEARTASQKSQNLAEQNWYSTRTSDTSLRRPRTLLYRLGARCSSNGQRMGSKQQPIQSAAGGGGWILTQQRYSVLYLPHEGTRKGKRPVLAALHCGRSFSTRRTPRPSVQQGAAFGATTGRPAGKIGGRAWVVGARLLPVLEPELAGAGAGEL
jgi:hypothetical protein